MIIVVAQAVVVLFPAMFLGSLLCTYRGLYRLCTANLGCGLSLVSVSTWVPASKLWGLQVAV